MFSTSTHAEPPVIVLCTLHELDSTTSGSSMKLFIHLGFSLLLPEFEFFIEPLCLHRTPIHHRSMSSPIAPSVDVSSSLFRDLR
ncbi:hypothetical protein Bca4012_009054 [Brassica carinata]